MSIPATEVTTAVSTEVIIIGAGPTGLTLVNQLQRFGIYYRESCLSQPTPLEELPVKPGDRLPYFEVEGEGIYQRLKAPCFHLLILHDGQSDLEPLYAEIEALSLLQPVICPLYPFLVDRFESASSISLLVRPDLHVACVADITDLEPLMLS